jgi:DNA-binding CsgD family transcriptional regulator
VPPRPNGFDQLPIDVLTDALDALDCSIVILAPTGGAVAFANHSAFDAALVANGELCAELSCAAAEYRELRTALARHHAVAPAQPFRFRGAAWYARVSPLQGGRELLSVSRQRLRDRELTQKFQLRYQLTDRQADVLLHILRGHATHEIAGALDVREPTVRRHLSELLAALDVKSKLEVFMLAEQFRSGG